MIRRGEALVELALSLLLLSLVLTSALGALADELTGILRLGRLDACHWGAQWWFSRLPENGTPASLRAMPDATPDGAVRFEWDVREEGGEMRVLLSTRAAGDGRPLMFERGL